MTDDYILREDALYMATVHEDCGEPIIELIEKIPAADVEPKQRWISVTERVPEKYGTYLVCTARGAVMVGCYYPKAKNWNVRATVAYWMPLPGKPKGEDDERC